MTPLRMLPRHSTRVNAPIRVRSLIMTLLEEAQMWRERASDERNQED